MADFDVQKGSYRGRWFDEHFSKDSEEERKAERIWDRARAEAIQAKVLGKKGDITQEKKATTQAPPLLYDLTSLQREANSRYSFSARRTLQIAQQLYERHKVITYPRTDRDIYRRITSDSRPCVLVLIDPTLAPHAHKVLEIDGSKPTKRIFNDAKITDHNAIIPTDQVPRNLDEKRSPGFFDLVARRFVAVFHPSAQFEITTRITRVEGEAFKTEGRIIKDPGWLAVYGRQATGEQQSDTLVDLVPVSKR